MDFWAPEPRGCHFTHQEGRAKVTAVVDTSQVALVVVECHSLAVLRVVLVRVEHNDRVREHVSRIGRLDFGRLGRKVDLGKGLGDPGDLLRLARQTEGLEQLSHRITDEHL